MNVLGFSVMESDIIKLQGQMSTVGNECER